MAVQKGYTGRAVSIPRGMMTGLMIQLCTTVLAAAMLAKLIDGEIMSWENIGYGISAAVIGASFLGALAACSRVKRRYALTCLLAGTVYFAALLLTCALFLGGQYEGVAVTGGLITAGSGCAYLMKMSPKRGGKRRTVGKDFVKLYKK